LGIKVEKLDYISFAKFYAIIAALFGLIYGIGILIFSPVGGAIFIVIGIIGGLVFGFIGGLIFALLYNLIFKRIVTFEVN
jgi:hypothetical protein